MSARWIVLAMLLGACESAPPSPLPLAALDVTKAVPFPEGIYDVTVDLMADDCTPLSPSGALQQRFVGVNVDRDVGPTVPTLDPEACWTIVNILQSEQYAYHLDFTRCFNTDHIDAAITLASPDEFVVHRNDLTEGEFKPCPIPPIVPQACHLEQTVRYKLVKACPPGAAVYDTGEGNEDCR